RRYATVTCNIRFAPDGQPRHALRVGDRGAEQVRRVAAEQVGQDFERAHRPPFRSAGVISKTESISHCTMVKASSSGFSTWTGELSESNKFSRASTAGK